MGKKKHVTETDALQNAAKSLKTAMSVAEARGEAETLANISLTWMELAGKLASKALHDKESSEKKIGFHHES